MTFFPSFLSFFNDQPCMKCEAGLGFIVSVPPPLVLPPRCRRSALFSSMVLFSLSFLLSAALPSLVSRRHSSPVRLVTFVCKLLGKEQSLDRQGSQSALARQTNDFRQGYSSPQRRRTLSKKSQPLFCTIPVRG